MAHIKNFQAKTVETPKPLRVAIAQLPITGDVRTNGGQVRRAMRQAAKGGARLVQFPEGMLSGYAKEQIASWADVDWQTVRKELAAVMELAAELGLWVVLGSAHPLTPPHWPHNSLYIISDQGRLINRYDKRILSYNEVNNWYTAGFEPVVFELDGFRFGCIICVEINFPQLFMEYADLGVDCLLLSAYPVDSIFYVKAQAHAAIHNYWLSIATPSQTSAFIASALIGPDGETLAQAKNAREILIVELDPSSPQFDIALNKAKPWRASVATDSKYQTRQLNDSRSVNRTCL